MFCFPNTGHVIILQENCFFQISSYSRAYLRIIYEKTTSQVPLGPLVGKKNILAKEVYWAGAPKDNFRENICSEDDLRSRIFGTFVAKFLACLPLLGFSNI